MKATELYDKLSSRTDMIQAKLKNGAADQFTHSTQLQETQARMKKVMEIIMAGGDRDLTGIEVMNFGANDDHVKP